MAMDLPSGAIWGSVRRAIRPMLSMPKRAPRSVADRARNRGASFLRSMANLLEGITIMASTGMGKRTPLWWNDGPEMKQPLGTRQAAQRALAFGQTVTVKVRDIDQCKRTAAEIILPAGRNLNQELVRARLAWWYQQYGCRVGVVPRQVEHRVGRS